MIEHIQRYKVIVTISIVAVAAGFLLGGSDMMKQPGGGGAPVLRIAGRTYDEREFQKFGSSSFELVSNLAQTGDFGLYQFLMGLSSGATSQNDAVEKFFVGRMILRQAKEEFGVYPGEEAVSDYVRSLRAFADKDSKFDPALYRNFVEKVLGRFGMNETDLRNLVSDVLAAKTLNSIIGSGLGVNREIAAKNLALENQQISGALGRLALDPFEAEIQPTDEEIEAYWENIQDAFTTETLRKFSYVIVSPDLPADAEAEAAVEAPESIVEAAASDEAKKAAAKKKEEEKALRAAELAETKRKTELASGILVDQFATDLVTAKGEGFEEMVAENGWELKTTELFARSSPPKELDLTLRKSSRGDKIADELFRIEPTSDELSKISQPIAVGENQWVIARLESEEKSRPKTFEEAKIEARAQYIAEKAAAAMKAAANEAVTKIQDGLAAGKSFAEAAKEAGIAEVKEFTKVTTSYRADTASEPSTLFEAVRNIDPGSLAEPVIEADRAFVIHVATREVVKEADLATRLDNEIKARLNENETIAFTAWISERIEGAKVERLYRN